MNETEERKRLELSPEEEAVLKKFSDDDLFAYIEQRHTDNAMPKIRKQIQILSKMEQLAEELEEYEIDNPDYRNGLEITQIQDHVSRYLKTLNQMKNRARKFGI